jgi:hypothetical protein
MKTPSTMVCASLLMSVGAFASTGAVAGDDHRSGGDDHKSGKIVTVAFGAGLNTAQPGNAANHHVLPDVIKVKVGDVVSFNVAGLHVIRVYERGVRLRDIKDQIPDECEVNPVPATCFPGGPVPVIPTFDLEVYYEGLNSIPPAVPPAVPPFAPLSLAQNRIEPVSFLKPGRFLVICAVLPHFNDKMYAWVEVTPRDDD